MAWKFFNSSGQEIVSDTVADGSITFAKMAANSINSDQYVDGSIDGVHIANDVIDSQHYAAASIDNEHLADNAVDSAELAAGAIDTAHIAASQITNALMADDAIGIAELSATGTASSSTFLRGDNAWSAPGGPSQATQSAIEAETNEDTYLPPDLVKNSPGVAKALARWDTNPDGFSAEYNMTSVTDGGSAGNSDLVWDINLTGTTVFYPVFCGDGDGQAVTYVSGTITATGLTALSFATATNAGADRNDNFMVLFGTQV